MESYISDSENDSEPSDREDKPINESLWENIEIIDSSVVNTAMSNMRENKDRRIKIFGTTALFAAFFSLGLCIAITGPTLLDLQDLVQTTTDKITYIYFARSGSYLLGSLVGGIVLDWAKEKQEYFLSISNMCAGIATLLIPFCKTFFSLCLVIGLSGMFMGCLDTGGNVLCLRIWAEKSAPYFQALHFIFGVGAFVSPLIVSPFLSNPLTEIKNRELNVTETITIMDTYNVTNISNGDINDTEHALTQMSIPQVTYAYATVGMITIVISIFLCIVSISCPQRSIRKKENDIDNSPKIDKMFTVIVVAISQLLLAVYCGIEIGYGQMLAMFAVKGNLHLTKSVGSFLTSTFWGIFTLGRGISVFLAVKFETFAIILSDLGTMLVASIILITLSNQYVESLWVGTIVLALGIASFYPSMISWIDKYINVTNKVASTFVVSASLGEMVIPILVSNFMSTIPLILIYAVFVCAVLGWIFTLLLWFIMTRKGEKARVTETSVHNAQDIPKTFDSFVN